MPFPQNYKVKVTTNLRTLTVNEVFNHDLDTGNLPSAATPIAQDFLNVITNGSLTPKSIQGHLTFGALSGRTLGGQATYYNLPNGAATPFSVEPEHRTAFAIGPEEWNKSGQSPVLLLAAAIQNKILQSYYEWALYRH